MLHFERHRANPPEFGCYTPKFLQGRPSQAAMKAQKHANFVLHRNTDVESSKQPYAACSGLQFTPPLNGRFQRKVVLVYVQWARENCVDKPAYVYCDCDISASRSQLQYSCLNI